MIAGNTNERLEWMVETGILTHANAKYESSKSPDKKYVSRIDLRMQLDIGSCAMIFVQYDSSGSWEHISTVTGTTLRTFSLPIRPKRCDHLRLKIQGEGVAKIFSIAKTFEQGSDL